MGRDRSRRYVEGNTARKIQPARRPGREDRQDTEHSRRRQAEKVPYADVFYTIFLAAAACMLLWSCVRYLQLQQETTSRVKRIALLETELEEKRKENDDDYTRIMTSVDLDYIKSVAINELGMVYAQPDQVILYDGGTKDYVRQSGEIPKEQSSLKEQILGE